MLRNYVFRFILGFVVRPASARCHGDGRTGLKHRTAATAAITRATINFISLLSLFCFVFSLSVLYIYILYTLLINLPLSLTPVFARERLKVAVTSQSYDVIGMCVARPPHHYTEEWELSSYVNFIILNVLLRYFIR